MKVGVLKQLSVVCGRNPPSCSPHRLVLALRDWLKRPSTAPMLRDNTTRVFVRQAVAKLAMGDRPISQHMLDCGLADALERVEGRAGQEDLQLLGNMVRMRLVGPEGSCTIKMEDPSP